MRLPPASLIDAVAVVIPARNEEELVCRALHAVRRAADEVQAHLGIRAPNVEIVLVADHCQDSTAELAGSIAGVRVHEVSSATVGSARAAGIGLALNQLRIDAHVPPERVWLANTDADSVVPVHWLTDQLSLAGQGADMVVGTVRPDFADLSEDQISRWCATHIPGRPNGHVHGANLGVRADVYLAAGGFLAQSEHEDVDLVDRVRQQGAQVCASDSGEVMTSGRLHGRTPSGYAGFLRKFT